ncbi:hypothetical protein [Absidia glauca]|uniref:Uncharacterized protein n=1 Tax=Absidia glauca TaxID=4829 RepID=A0A168P6E3_ABSGL|nr:hypothetical protein [Absidia glauca]
MQTGIDWFSFDCAPLTKRNHTGWEEESSVRTPYKHVGLVVINHGVCLDLDGKYQLLTSNVPIGEVRSPDDLTGHSKLPLLRVSDIASARTSPARPMKSWDTLCQGYASNDHMGVKKGVCLLCHQIGCQPSLVTLAGSDIFDAGSSDAGSVKAKSKTSGLTRRRNVSVIGYALWKRSNAKLVPTTLLTLKFVSISPSKKENRWREWERKQDTVVKPLQSTLETPSRFCTHTYPLNGFYGAEHKNLGSKMDDDKAANEQKVSSTALYWMMTKVKHI